MVSLVREYTTSVADLKKATEPSVEELESGWIGASDGDLWQSLHRLAREDERLSGCAIDRDMLFALDDTSKVDGK